MFSSYEWIIESKDLKSTKTPACSFQSKENLQQQETTKKINNDSVVDN